MTESQYRTHAAEVLRSLYLLGRQATLDAVHQDLRRRGRALPLSSVERALGLLRSARALVSSSCPAAQVAPASYVVYRLVSLSRAAEAVRGTHWADPSGSRWVLWSVDHGGGPGDESDVLRFSLRAVDERGELRPARRRATMRELLTGMEVVEAPPGVVEGTVAALADTHRDRRGGGGGASAVA